MTKKTSSAYQDAGVNIDAGMKAVDLMKRYVKTTMNKNVITDLGSFGGMFSFNGGILVASADGVGTKLKLAYHTGKHDTIGQDLVNHCVNDILVMGAEPLFFLDYFGTTKLVPEVAAEVVKGLSIACKENGCALLGGETAELPGIYKDNEYDLAGFIVGSIPKEGVIDTTKIKSGDIIIGIASSGLQTNGYSLALKVLPPEKNTDKLNEVLMKPHKSFLNSVRELRKKITVHGLVHITGGGFYDNIPRVLPKGVSVQINKGSWHVPSVFTMIQEKGSVSDEEMHRVFNMGIGMMAIVEEKDKDLAIESLKASGERVFLIGKVIAGDNKVILI